LIFGPNLNTRIKEKFHKHPGQSSGNIYIPESTLINTQEGGVMVENFLPLQHNHLFTFLFRIRWSYDERKNESLLATTPTRAKPIQL
jgi:hypothetical protein